MAALAAGATHEQAAIQAGVSVSTVARRLKDPAFQVLLQQARENLLQTTTEYLVCASVQAGETLRALLGPENPAPVRLGAARGVLDFALKFHNELSLVQRLEALEQRLQLLTTTNSG